MDRRALVARLLTNRGDLMVITGIGSATYDVAACGDHLFEYVAALRQVDRGGKLLPAHKYGSLVLAAQDDDVGCHGTRIHTYLQGPWRRQGL